MTNSHKLQPVLDGLKGRFGRAPDFGIGLNRRSVGVGRQKIADKGPHVLSGGARQNVEGIDAFGGVLRIGETDGRQRGLHLAAHGIVGFARQGGFQQFTHLRGRRLEHRLGGRQAGDGVGTEQGQPAERGADDAPQSVVDADFVDGSFGRLVDLGQRQRIPEQHDAALGGADHHLAVGLSYIKASIQEGLEGGNDAGVARRGELFDGLGLGAETLGRQPGDVRLQLLGPSRRGGYDGERRDQHSENQGDDRDQFHRADRVAVG